MTIGLNTLRKVRERGRQAMLELAQSPKIIPEATSAQLVRLKIARRTGPKHRAIALTYGGRCLADGMLAEIERLENS